jgi:hypothetical protein
MARTPSSYRVTFTGWMHDETFVDHADVTALDEDEAARLALLIVENRWNGTLEIGDCNVERMVTA